jgi:hypothetical protein
MSLAEGAITIPGYKGDSWWTVGIFTASGFLDPDKPIRKYTKTVNLTYEGLIPKVHKSVLSKDPDALHPHRRAPRGLRRHLAKAHTVM